MALFQKQDWGFKKPPETPADVPASEPVAETATAVVERPQVSAPSVPPGGQMSESESRRQREIEELKLKIHQRLINEVDISRFLEEESSLLTSKIKEAVNQLLAEENALLSSSERERLVQNVVNETMGLGPLEPLLSDPTVNDILINGPYEVYVERAGRLQKTDTRFKNDTHLLQIIDRIVSSVGRRVDESVPYCDARLRDGSRFNCVIPPLSLKGPLVSIRKFSKDPLKIQDLINYNTLSKEAATLLEGFVKARLNIVISGGTGSGKTTLLNVLSGFIPDTDRIITIEDAAELQLQQSHVVQMETRPANLEGKGEVSQRDLLRNALRMRPERIVVGECRAGEALDMLQAMNTGHDGSLTTLHANSPRDALRRLETMVLMAGYELPTRAIREQVASAVHIIVQVSRLSDGTRKVMNITEVVGMEEGTILLQDIFTFEKRGLDEEGRVMGEFKSTGIRPRFLDTLVNAGIKIDASIFEGGLR